MSYSNRIYLSRTRAFFGAMLLLLVFLSACAGTESEVRETATTPQKPLIWPSPPEPARISWFKSISKPEDIGADKGFFRKVAEFLLGPRSDQMVKPYGITVDSTGRVIVADTALKRIHIYDSKKNKYSHIDEAGDESLESPISVAVDAEDNIYATDSLKNKVLVFTSKGKYIRSFPAGKRPTGIAVNKLEKTVFVTDTARHEVAVYDLKGRLLKAIGRRGNGAGEFNYPVDIFISAQGELFVADTMNYRVQIFGKDGRFVSMFGRHGDGTGDFGRPKGVSVDKEGNVYVADALFDTVQIFDRNGNFLLNFGRLGREYGSFWLPSGVFIDSGDKIYVSDSYNRRIQVFEYHGQS